MSTRALKKACNSRRFTKDGVTPFEMFEYDYRDSVIKNPNGEKVFEMNNVEVPKQWSQIATDILAQKYFRKAGVPQPDGSVGRETSVKQVAHRMANCWRVWGERYGYFASEQDAKYFMMNWCTASSTRPAYLIHHNGSIPVCMRVMASPVNHRDIIS
jgi:ribonucleoside-diphosphate reductase alpha chain